MLRKSLNGKSIFARYSLYINIVLLSLIGIIMVYEASLVYAQNNFGDKYHFLILQTGWIVIGLTLMFIISKIKPKILEQASVFLWVLSILFLIATLFPTPFAQEIYGARRWLTLNPEGLLPQLPIIGRANFQPGEFAKLSSVLFFSNLVNSDKYKNYSDFGKFARYFSLAGLTVGLIALQPNFSTSLVLLLIISSIYFLSGGSLKFIYATMPFATIGIIAYVISSEYRRLRIMTLFSPEDMDPLKSGYHINQIMIALGSGGPFGLGLGRSRQKYDYLPEATADSIFAIIGEEIGFIGAMLVIALLVWLIWQCFTYASDSKDRFLGLASGGVCVWIMTQTFINLGAMVRILPITGIPLPLLSYGGSSAIFILLALGIVINSSRYTKIESDEKL